jgi:hypothetical protein
MNCWGIDYGNLFFNGEGLVLLCITLLLTIPMFSHQCFEKKPIFFAFCLFILSCTVFFQWIHPFLAFIPSLAIYQFLGKPKDSSRQFSEPWLIYFLTVSFLLFVAFRYIFHMPLPNMASSLLIAYIAYPLSLFIVFLFNTIKFSWLKQYRPKDQPILIHWMMPSFVATLLISYPTVLTSYFGGRGSVSTGLIMFFFAFIITLVFLSVKPISKQHHSMPSN